MSHHAQLALILLFNQPNLRQEEKKGGAGIDATVVWRGHRTPRVESVSKRASLLGPSPTQLKQAKTKDTYAQPSDTVGRAGQQLAPLQLHHPPSQPVTCVPDSTALQEYPQPLLTTYCKGGGFN
jgi:hypothetical protein